MKVLALEVLPFDIIGLIVEFAGFHAAITLSECSTALSKIVSNPHIWQRLCDGLWPSQFQNIELFQGDFKALIRDRNGWFPQMKRPNYSVNGKIILGQRRNEQEHYVKRIDDDKGLGSDEEESSPNIKFSKNLSPRVKRRQVCQSINDSGIVQQRSPDTHWVSEMPLFNISHWVECPRKENVMDLRKTESYCILTTAAWNPELLNWRPKSPQILSHCPLCLMTRCQCSNEMLRLTHVSRIQGALMSPSVRWRRRMSLSPQSSVSISAGLTTVLPSSLNQQRNLAEQKIISHICIRNRRSLEVVQRHQINTASLNCLDGGTNEESCDKPSLFAIGDDSGHLYLLKQSQKSIEQPFQLTRINNTSTEVHLEEINDLRLAKDNKVAIVRTLTRYPAYFEIFDLASESSSCYPPTSTQGYWIHALELASRRTSNMIYAVGENCSNGLFAILTLDMRTKQKVICVNPQTRQMLWPLRIYKNYVFANAVVPVWESGGIIVQLDRRRMMPSAASSFLVRDEEAYNSSNAVVATYPSGLIRLEDFRCMHNHIYMYGIEGSNLTIYRSKLTTPSEKERLIDIDVLMSPQRLGNVLKLFHCDERGWTSTCGPRVYDGSFVPRI